MATVLGDGPGRSYGCLDERRLAEFTYFAFICSHPGRCQRSGVVSLASNFLVDQFTVEVDIWMKRL